MSVPTLVYIAGLNYSGSTLLALLLAGHSRIGTTGEITGPPHFDAGRPFACSCGSPIRDCPFYRALECRIDMPGFRLAEHRWNTRAVSQPPRLCERLLFGSLPLPLGRVRDALRAHVAFPLGLARDCIRLNDAFIRAAAALLCVEILVDSSKSPAQLPMLAWLPGLRLRVIHLVRHPGGCALSAARHHGHSAETGARIWVANYRACVRSLAALPPGHATRVRYEDLSGNPEKTLRALCEFLELDYDPAMLRFRERAHHVVGNRMRLEASTDIAADERWRTEWPLHERLAIEDIARREMQECHYA